MHRQHSLKALISRGDQLEVRVSKRSDDRFCTSRSLWIRGELSRFQESPGLMQGVIIAVEDFNDALLEAWKGANGGRSFGKID